MNSSTSSTAQSNAIVNGAIKALCERELYQFLKFGWSHVDPSPFRDDWYIKVLCDEMQRLWRGEIKRLIINIPPRCAKSSICCVFFPVWCWIQDPTTKILSGAHAQSLSVRDTLKSRNLINSNFFQELWGDKVTLSPDQNQKTFYTNTQQGERMSFSVGGAITGAGGDIIIVDDAINADDANSDVVRNSVNRWFDESLTTRLNDPRTGRMLVIMQRLHQNDLAGYLLAKPQKEWEHICLPMRYEGVKSPYDQRTTEGEILSVRYDEESLQRLEGSLGIYATASQLQQQPEPREGGIIKHAWFLYYSELPVVKRWSWSWDTAIKEGQNNDFSVGTLWAECENGYYLVNMFRKKIGYPALRNQVRISYDSQPSSEVLVEDKSSGQQIVQDFRRIGTMPVIGMMPGKDMPLKKFERLELVSPLFQAGKVFFPKGKAYVDTVNHELTSFPNALHDDVVDSVTQYLCRRLGNKKLDYGFL